MTHAEERDDLVRTQSSAALQIHGAAVCGKPQRLAHAGEVYRARDTRLDRIVAIKVLPANLTSNDASRAEALP